MTLLSRVATTRAGCALLAFACLAPQATAAYRSIDGSGNNAANPTWGAAGSQLQRLSPAAYPNDGSGATMNESLPAPRDISNAVFAQTSLFSNSRGMTNGVWQWGQFIDHDISLTATAAANGATMMMSPDDPYGLTMIPFSRSDYDQTTGTGAANPRQQVNSISSYMDGSMVYGSDAFRATSLRTGVGGKLKMSADGRLLPKSTDDAALGAVAMDDGGLGASPLFVAGDFRANEQVGLTSLQTLFAREHNRLTDELAANNPSWNDELLYQTARKVVGAEIQAITYNEFLPAMLGDYAPRAEDYSYDPSVNATVATEFSTALFRVGHTMLSPELTLAGDNGEKLGSISLRESFFNPSVIGDDPSVVDHILMGLAMSQSQEIDSQLVDDVRNFLFTPDGGPGMDLASLNIQRGRDHGLADYNTVREAFDLPAVTGFDEITSDLQLQAALESLYESVDKIDLWVGALAEDHVDGAGVGPTILAGMVDQFTRLRDGDAFFYTGDASLQSYDITAVMDLDSLTFMDIMNWNTGLDGMPSSFFMGAPVPEPATLPLLVAGVAMLATLPKRRPAAKS